MCGSRSCRQQILDAGGIQFLSDLLHPRPARAPGRKSSLDSGVSGSTFDSIPELSSSGSPVPSPTRSPGSDSGGSLASSCSGGSPGATLDRCIMGISHRDIHQKAAIALGRLCHDYETCMMVVSYNGRLMFLPTSGWNPRRTIIKVLTPKFDICSVVGLP